MDILGTRRYLFSKNSPSTDILPEEGKAQDFLYSDKALISPSFKFH